MEIKSCSLLKWSHAGCRSTQLYTLLCQALEEDAFLRPSYSDSASLDLVLKTAAAFNLQCLQLGLVDQMSQVQVGFSWFRAVCGSQYA